MPRFAKRTNKTRDKQRPPRLSPAVNAAILAHLDFVRAKPAPKPADLRNGSNKKRAIASQDLPKPKGNQPATSGLPPLKGQPAGKQPVEKQPPAANEHSQNGHPPRSSLFRPGAYATMPALRIPPKAVNPAQKPPAMMQIPMEISQHPDADQGQNGTPRNEAPVEPEQQQPQPVDRPEDNAVSPSPVPPEPPAPGATASETGLDELLKQNETLPAQAVVFGVCDDGLPVLLDLRDPAPGATVVIGDERELQLEFLRTAVISVARRNSPRGVQFLVISRELDAWKKWVVEKGFERHCLGIISAEEGQVRDWIIRLADWTEQRRMGQSSGPAVLLVMDTLSFLSRLEYDVRLNFDWMAKEGPQAQIWPLAAISTDLAKALGGQRMLRGFQTRILGYANQPADTILLAGVSAQEAETFNRRGEFAVRVGQNWLRFKLPGR